MNNDLENKGKNNDSSNIQSDIATIAAPDVAPSGLSLNGKSILYVGTTNTSTMDITLTWTGIGEPDIFGYNIYGDDTSVAIAQTTGGVYETTYTFRSVLKINRTYTVASRNKDGVSPRSRPAQLVLIARPETPSFTTHTENTTDGTVTCSWNKVSVVTGATVDYIVTYPGGSYTGSGTSHSFTLPASMRGQSATVTIQARANADGGDYMLSDTDQFTVNYISSFSLPTDFWQAYYDDVNDTEGKRQFAYSSVTLKWKNLGSGYSYLPQYSVNEGNTWNNMTNNRITGTTYRESGFSSMGEGARVQFRVEVQDKYGQKVISAPILITRLAKPSLSNLTWAQAGNSASTGFNWRFGTVNAPRINGTVYLTVDNTAAQSTFTLTTSDQTPKTVNFDITPNNTASASAFNKKIYDLIITKGQSGFTGEMTVSLSYEGFPTCKATASRNVEFVYKGSNLTIDSFAYEIAGDATRRYAVSGDTIKFSFSAASAANVGGGKFSYSITGDGVDSGSITPTSGWNYSVSVSNQYSSTMTRVFTLTATLLYTDGTSLQATKTVNVPFARWTATDKVMLNNLVNDNGIISGNILLPTGLWSDTSLGNVSYIRYMLVDDKETTLFTDYRIDNNLSARKTIPFKADKTVPADVDAVVHLILYVANIKQVSLRSDSQNYVVRVAGVPLAIRSGRVGINVPPTFSSEGGNSALYITSKAGVSNDKDAVTVIDTTGAESRFIDFIDNDKLLGTIRNLTGEFTMTGMQFLMLTRGRDPYLNLASTPYNTRLSISNDDSCTYLSATYRGDRGTRLTLLNNAITTNNINHALQVSIYNTNGNYSTYNVLHTGNMAASVVTLYTTQAITGQKTFTQDLYVTRSSGTTAILGARPAVTSGRSLDGYLESDVSQNTVSIWCDNDRTNKNNSRRAIRLISHSGQTDDNTALVYCYRDVNGSWHNNIPILHRDNWKTFIGTSITGEWKIPANGWMGSINGMSSDDAISAIQPGITLFQSSPDDCLTDLPNNSYGSGFIIKPQNNPYAIIFYANRLNQLYYKLNGLDWVLLNK